MAEEIFQFFNHPFFVVVGALSTLVMIGGFIGGFIFPGVKFFIDTLPVWFKLGMGLHNRKIAVFSEKGFIDFKDMLGQSGLFHEKNILHIGKEFLGKAKEASIYLVDWPDFKGQLQEILNLKGHNDALIIYCPKPHRIGDEELAEINMKRNVFLVNFRGRLMNDILIAMMTTACR